MRIFSKILNFPCFLAVIASLLFFEPVTRGREWTDSTGRYKVEAELESISEDGNTISLKKSDGQMIRIPYKKLGAKDRQYVKEIQAEKQQVQDRQMIEAASVEAGPPRLWHNRNFSRTLLASFLMLSEDGKTAFFQKADGRVARLPYQELSELDQRYIALGEVLESLQTMVDQDEELLASTETEPLYGGKTLEVPFNPNVETLPPDFQGHDLKTLMDVFREVASIKKDEFETSQEYQIRRERILREPLFGSVRCTSTLAILLPDFLLVPEYDADTEFFRIKSSDLDDLVSFDHIIMDVDSRVLRRYIASNAFGVEVEVTEKRRDSFMLRYEPLEKTKWTFFDRMISIPKKDAEYTKSVMRAMIVCRANFPYASTRYDHQEPTRDDPIELHDYDYILHVTRTRIVIFNSETGEIYTTIPVSSLPNLLTEEMRNKFNAEWPVHRAKLEPFLEED